MDHGIFENLGWHIDYRLNGKYIGSELVSEPDRFKTGYEGRVQRELEEDIILRGKRYKKGTLVVTECVPLCGRVKGDRLKILEDSVEWRNQLNYS